MSSTVENGFRLVDVDAASRSTFVAYALEHGAEYDDSYTQPEDLARFDPAEEPAAIALEETGIVIGAASLILRGYATEGTARFRIAHARSSDTYRALLEHLADRAPEAVRTVFLFVPDDPVLADVLSAAGFTETRRALVLRREGEADVMPPPAGVLIAEADPDDGALPWTTVSNLAFSGYSGRFDMTLDGARETLASERILPGGALIAWLRGSPVGIVLVSADTGTDGEPVAAVDTLAVAPVVQGTGIGRALLRAAVTAALAAGFGAVELSTNAANERALSLYRTEGFDVVDVRICWTKER